MNGGGFVEGEWSRNRMFEAEEQGDPDLELANTTKVFCDDGFWEAGRYLEGDTRSKAE